MLTSLLKLIPAKPLVIGTGICVALVGGGAYLRHWHNQKVALAHRAHQQELDRRTQEHLDRVHYLEGRVVQLQAVVDKKEADLTEAKRKLAAALSKPLPPLPDPPQGPDPCAEVREVAAQREAILVEQRDTAVAAQADAEAIIPLLEEQLRLETAAKFEIKSALELQKEKTITLTLDRDRALESAHRWKVGGLTVGIAGVTYIVVHALTK